MALGDRWGTPVREVTARGRRAQVLFRFPSPAVTPAQFAPAQVLFRFLHDGAAAPLMQVRCERRRRERAEGQEGGRVAGSV